MTSQDEQKHEEGDKPSFFQDVKDALHNRCPRCKNASIFESPFALNPREECPSCGFKLSAHDNGDGPAVFLIFILGFLLVPFAIVTQLFLEFPLWFNTIFWTAIALILCLVLMRPLKSYIMLLQYRHLPKTFGEDENEK